MADMMMPAGVHAARHLEFQLADVVQVIEVGETSIDLRRDRNRTGIGQRAEIEARAADHVSQQTDVGGREMLLAQGPPQFVEIGFAHVGQH